MSDVSLFAGDRFYRSQFNTGQASYTVFQKDGVTYADSGYPGGAPYSGSTAIQDAITALPAGIIEIKAGIYLLNSGLTGKNEVVLCGESVSDSGLGTVLKANASMTNLFDLTGKSHFGIYNINFDGNNLATNGINASDPAITRNLARLDKVTVQNCLGDGINMSHMEDSTIFDCLSTKNNVNLRWSQSGSASHITRSTFGRATTSSLVLGGTQHSLSQCVFTQFTSPAAGPSNAIISVDAFLSVLGIKDCWFESPSGTMIKTETGITLGQLDLDGVYMIDGTSATCINILGQIISLKNWKLETYDGTQITGLTTIGGGNKQIEVKGFTTAGSPTPAMFGTLTTPHRVLITQNQQGGNFNPNLFPSYRATVDPTTTDILVNTFALWERTDTGTVKLYYNDDGVLKSVALV